MKGLLLLFVLAAHPCGISASGIGNLATITEISFSPDGQHIAIQNDLQRTLTIVAGDRIGTPFDFPAGVRIVNMLWSENGRYLAVEFETGGDETSVRLVDMKNSVKLEEIGVGQQIAWLGNRLLIMPDAGVDEFPKEKGLQLYDPAQSRTEHILADFVFAGPLSVSSNKLVARIVSGGSEAKPGFAIIVHDFTTKTTRRVSERGGG